jgi:hypothetical protein
MSVRGLDALLWALGFLAHIILLSILLCRHRARRFPAFTILIGANVVRTIVLYCTLRYGSRDAYFYTYWTLAILDVSLQLGVVREMASHVFKPLGRWASDVRKRLLWLVSASLLIAALLTWLGTPRTSDWREALVIQGGFFSATLMSELFVGMIALSVIAGLPVKDHTARISQGLGVYSLACILIEAIDTVLGSGADASIRIILTHVRMAVYLCCVAFWIIMLWREEPRARTLPDAARRQLSLLQLAASYDLKRIKGRK